MFKRVDRLLIDLPQVEYGDPNAAAAVQELFTWNNEGYYEAIRKIWKGNHPQTNAPLIVIDGSPKGAKIPDLDDLPEEFASGIGPDQFEAIAKRLLANM